MHRDVTGRDGVELEAVAGDRRLGRPESGKNRRHPPRGGPDEDLPGRVADERSFNCSWGDEIEDYALRGAKGAPKTRALSLVVRIEEGVPAGRCVHREVTCGIGAGL